MSARARVLDSRLIWVFLALILAAAIAFFLSRPDRPGPVARPMDEIYLPGYPLYSESAERMPVQLFFPDIDLDLKMESREIYRSDETADRLRQVVVLTLGGPRAEGLLRPFSEGVRLRELYLYEGTVYVDLDIPEKAAMQTGTFMEHLAVRALEASLVQGFPEVERLRIVRNGQEVETLFGHIDVRYPRPAFAASPAG